MTAEAVILMVDRSLNLVHNCIYFDLPKITIHFCRYILW